jgi:iron complex outermembrane receptor protein
MKYNIQSDILRSAVGRRNRNLLVGVASVALLMPDFALAQAVNAYENSNDIIVTANRREERAQDVPISITAVSGEGLRERSITNLQDMQASVPSLVVAPNGQASRDVMSPSIRGQSASFQGGPGVVVYMNEVPLPSGYTLSSQGGPGNFVDLQSVQVLSGAQGTLFGRNTTGGAILLTPAKPTDKLEGYLSGGFGNYDLTDFEAVLNVPLTDKIRVRLVGAARDRDGFTYDVNWRKDRDDLHTRMARIGVEIEPVEGVTNYTMVYYGSSHSNGPGTIAQNFNTAYFRQLDSFVPSFDFCKSAGNCNYYTNLIAQQQQLGPRKTAHGVDDFSKIKTWGVTNVTDVELQDTLKLRNIISYATLKQFYSTDQDGTIAPIYDTGSTANSFKFPRDNFKLFTEELQLQGSALSEKLTYTVGAFYSKQSPNGTMKSYAVNVCSNKSVAGCSLGTSQVGVTNESKALYAQATLDLGALTPALDRLRLTGGYRYTWDKIDGFTTSWSEIPIGGGNVLNLCSWKSQFTANPTADCRFEGHLKSSAPNWTIGIDYRPLDDLMLYAKVTRGYKAGGFNAYAVFPTTRTFGPEYVTDYEVGFKSDFNLGDMPTRLNVNGFYLDYSNIQRASGDRNAATGGNGAVTISTASAVIKGIEVEGMIKPIREVELGFNYSHLDAHYKSFTFDSNSGVYDCTATSAASPKVFPGADMSCRPLQYLSPNILSVYGRFQIPTSDKFGVVSLFVNYNWTDAQNTSPLAVEKFPNGDIFEPGVRLPSFGLLNASLDWKNALSSGLDVTLFGTNLTNKTYAISNTGTFQSIGAQSKIYGEPRMYGVRLRYSFGSSN